MKLKAKDNNDAIIEKFSAQSSKSAKYAKTVVKKREHNSEIGDALAGKKSDMLINEGGNSVANTTGAVNNSTTNTTTNNNT